MRSKKQSFYLFLVIVALYSWINAQTSTTTQPAVPRLVNFSGKVTDHQGKPVTGVTGVTFAIYKDQAESAPLWMETQNIHPDAKGNYTVQLGSTKSSGLPLDLFASGEAHWLGVHIDGQEEQPRTLLLSVPYALKAMDAETLGGKPASAFLQAIQSPGDKVAGSDAQAAKLPPVVHGSGVASILPLWTAKNTISNSTVSEDANGNIGIGTSTPRAKLDVAGSVSATMLTVQSQTNGAILSASNSFTAEGSTALIGTAGRADFGGTTFGVVGSALTDSGRGVFGLSGGATGTGVWGEASKVGTSGANGVMGVAHGLGVGVFGVNDHDGYGVVGSTTTGGASGVGAFNSSTGDALFAFNQSGGFAGFFVGDVGVDGNLSKSGGSFKIDHPLDPANKYLYHSFVESPDMKNIYDGTVTTDSEGVATVTMPDWFEALNQDFRYQLTAMGQFAQAIVAAKMANRQFTIKTDKPNVEVSWQVTGVRHDAWADAHRIPVEQMKEGKERGLYLHPELFGAPAEKSIAAARHPNAAKMAKEAAIPPTSLGKRY